jgi:hypothetical protein
MVEQPGGYGEADSAMQAGAVHAGRQGMQQARTAATTNKDTQTLEDSVWLQPAFMPRRVRSLSSAPPQHGCRLHSCLAPRRQSSAKRHIKTRGGGTVSGPLVAAGVARATLSWWQQQQQRLRLSGCNDGVGLCACCCGKERWRRERVCV